MCAVDIPLRTLFSLRLLLATVDTVGRPWRVSAIHPCNQCVSFNVDNTRLHLIFWQSLRARASLSTQIKQGYCIMVAISGV